MPPLTSSATSIAFMPHGHCYLWLPSLVWTQVTANLAIGLAYLWISACLALLVWRVRDIPFKAVYLAFGVFIVTCGFTHFMDVVTVWRPDYWTDGALRVVTAIASVGTAFLLPPLVPKAEALARGARAAHERGVKLEAVANELGTLYDRTRQVEQAKTQFFANVSHELRTPLALILGPAERLLADPALRPEQRRDLELVSRNARAVLAHVNDLLDVAKLEAGRLEVRWTRTDVAALVRRVASQFEPIAEARAIPFTIDASDAVTAEVDPEQLERVILNLLSNAFKFTPRGRPVRISARRVAPSPATERDGRGAFVVEIADGGPGIRPEHRELVFDRFRQLDGDSERMTGGTGLGLSIVRELVGLHGGEVTIDDAPEGGTRISVVLPTSAPAGAKLREEEGPSSAANAVRARQIAETLGAPAAAHDENAPSDKPLVLVVEDQPDMNRFVREALSDYRTAGAADGLDALERIERDTPDLIVTDVMMPRMSGERLIAAVRARPALEEVPVLVLSAKADDELRASMLARGAQDYVMKPFSPEELRARVHNLVTIKRSREVLQRAIETQHRDLETLAREVAHRNSELATALQSTRVAREAAEAASQTKSSFLRLISHELRTPITNAALQLEILRGSASEASSPLHEDAMRRLRRAVRRLSALVESLLQAARAESGRLTLHLAEVELAALAREVADEVGPQAEERGLALRVEGRDDLGPARTDPDLVRLIVLNLVTNAIKFTTGNAVSIRVAEVTEGHRIEVEDDGPGIPVEERRRIFEPFEQLEPSTRKTSPGVGLGLALVRQLSDALGAVVDLDDSPAGGTTFRLLIPRTVSPPSAPEEP